jgi:hypothetical protein
VARGSGASAVCPSVALQALGSPVNPPHCLNQYLDLASVETSSPYYLLLNNQFARINRHFKMESKKLSTK